MVGGTGLYIRAVTDSYAFGKKGSSIPLRESLSAEAEMKGLETLYNRLAVVDPAAASKIHPNDRRRIIRARHPKYILMTGAELSGLLKFTFLKADQFLNRSPALNAQIHHT